MDDVITRVEQLLHKVQSKFDELRNKINSLLSHVPSFLHWVIGKVEDLWDKLCAKMKQFWDWFTDKLAYAGDPWLLHDIGTSWNTKLGEPAHKRANEVDSDDLLVDDTWTGSSAAAYKSHIGGQKDALNNVGQNLATTVSSALNSMKTGILSFWAGVIAGLIASGVSIALGAGESATILGIPPGVATVIAGVVVFLAAAGAGVRILKSNCDDAKDAMNNALIYADPWPDFALNS